MSASEAQVYRLQLHLPELEYCLRMCLFEIDDEIEQRKCSGNDEHWSKLQKLSDRSHRVLKSLRESK